MCELFAMSSLHPATATFSLHEFARHGGLTAPHRDGWGVAFYQGTDAYLAREPGAACQSANLRFLEMQKMRSPLILAHIRQATLGARQLCNTQPFSRELGGRMHLFAHNGDLPALINHPTAPLGFYRPLGETDSEYAFCFLLGLLQHIWQAAQPPALAVRLAVVQQFAHALLPFGSANFLYSDSEYLFAHGHKRTQPLSGEIKPPGLFTLERFCLPHHTPSRPIQIKKFQGLALRFSAYIQRVQLIASVPLSSENWQPLDEGEILLIQQGQIVQRVNAL